MKRAGLSPARFSVTCTRRSRKILQAPRLRTRCLDKSELLQGGHAVIQADFFNDPAVFELKYGRAGEAHFPAGRGRQRSDEEIAECRTGMRAASVPTADYIVPLGDKISCTPEVEVWERFAETGHERLDVLAATSRLVQRVAQEHVGSSKFVDDVEVAVLAPKIGEPTAYDSLVVILFGHGVFLLACG